MNWKVLPPVPFSGRDYVELVLIKCCYCSVTRLCLTLRPQGLQQASLPCPSPSSLLKLMSIESRWCHPAISPSVAPFSSCSQSFPASGSFPMSWLLTSFQLWLSLFIPSAAISPLFPRNILDTYQPGVFIFQCHVFLPFHAVHGVLTARILKCFAIPFSSGSQLQCTLNTI